MGSLRGKPATFEVLLSEGAQTTSWDDVAARILDAAFEQFVAAGIRRSSLEDVARRAGIGRVTIYRKFAGKEKLVAALFRREVRSAISIVETAVTNVTDGEERIIAGFVAGISLVRNHPLLTMLSNEPETALPLLTVRAGTGLALARAFVAAEVLRAQLALGLVGDDAEMVAEILVRIMHSLVLTPRTRLPLDDQHIKEFARRHVVPLVTGVPLPA